MKKKKWTKVVWLIGMAVVSFIMIFPIVMMISTSFKTTGEINSPVFHFCRNHLILIIIEKHYLQGTGVFIFGIRSLLPL